VLRLDLAPVSMSLSDNDHVMALAEDGTAFLFDSLKMVQKKKKKVETWSPKGTLSLMDSESNEQRPIMASVFVELHILFARGFAVKPIFETVKVLDQEERIMETLTLSRTFEKSALFNAVSQPKDLKKKKNEHIVGREDLTMDVMHLATPQASTDDEEEEPTLADKLHDMALRTPEASPPPKSQRSKPNANSLYTMLTQAIHSNDEQFLERCLNVDSNLVIHTTVRRLTPDQVVPLLDLLLNRMRTKFTRTTQLMEWIRAILLSHSSYLMTLPGVVTRLGTLYQHLDSRVATFQKLLRLSGRLDLVMSQIETRRKQADEDLDTERQVPAVVYEEDEEEESEEEVSDMDALMDHDFTEEE
jgi:U3 small nucleolar RNA-associated protein 5